MRKRKEIHFKMTLSYPWPTTNVSEIFHQHPYYHLNFLHIHHSSPRNNSKKQQFFLRGQRRKRNGHRIILFVWLWRVWEWMMDGLLLLFVAGYVYFMMIWSVCGEECISLPPPLEEEEKTKKNARKSAHKLKYGERRKKRRRGSIQGLSPALSRLFYYYLKGNEIGKGYAVRMAP